MELFSFIRLSLFIPNLIIISFPPHFHHLSTVSFLSNVLHVHGISILASFCFITLGFSFRISLEKLAFYALTFSPFLLHDSRECFWCCPASASLLLLQVGAAGGHDRAWVCWVCAVVAAEAGLTLKAFAMDGGF